MNGQGVTIIVDKAEIAVSVDDVTEGASECTEASYMLCFFTSSLDAVIPVLPPDVGQAWEKNGTTFTHIAFVPTLKLLGTEYRNLYIVRAVRSGKRKPLGALKHFDLYYSYDAGLIGFLWATPNGEYRFLSSTPLGLVRNP